MEILDTQTQSTQITYRNYIIGTNYQTRDARIELVSNSPLRVGQEVFFQIVLSLPRALDTQKIKTRWDFDSDGVYDTGFLTEKVVSHIFSKTGKFSPGAQVLFEDGEMIEINGMETIPQYNGQRRIISKDWCKIKILPAQINAPILNIWPGNQVFSENITFRFDASGTKTTQTSWLEFHFDGEEVVKNKTVVSKKFASPGDHEIVLLHCFNRITPICEETRTTINIKPASTDFRVNFMVQNLSNTTVLSHGNNSYFAFTQGDRVRFSAQIFERDTQAKNYQYRWDFEGDGVFDTPFSSKTYTEFRYNQTGSFLPMLEVRNEFFEVGSKTVTHQKKITITKNTLPEGNIEIRNIRGRFQYTQLKKTAILAGETVDFQAKIYDKESSFGKLKVRFDLDGDGVWENTFGTRTMMTWQYEKAGNYEILMQVQDHSKAIRTIRKTIKVYEIPEIQIKVKVSQKEGDTQTNFTFDARESRGHRLKFYWKISGKVISRNASVPTLSARFDSLGQKDIVLRVVDSQNKEKQIIFSVFILPRVKAALSPDFIKNKLEM